MNFTAADFNRHVKAMLHSDADCPLILDRGPEKSLECMCQPITEEG